MEQAKPEFDDIVITGSFVASKKAVDAMRSLASEYHLSFLFDPGGGEFRCGDMSSQFYGFTCRISTYDDIGDLGRLRFAIERWKLTRV